MTTGKGHHRERRRYPRFRATGLMVNIGGHLVKIIDISASGMCIEAGFTCSDEIMPFAVYPTDGERLDLNKGLHGSGVVVRKTGNTVGIRFEPACLALVRLASEIIGRNPAPALEE